MRRATACAFPLAALLLAPAVAGARSARPYDFNGDGRQDLVAGMPSWATDVLREEMGAALVLPGTRRGVSSRAQLIAPSGLAVPGDSGSFDFLGTSLASGDFNGDGYADLAIGAPEAGLPRRGAVDVLYGSPAGVSGLDAQLITGPAPAKAGADTIDSQFGSALVSGDFNDDGFADLAVGAAGEDPVGPSAENLVGSGIVHLLFGGPEGIGSSPGRRIARPRAADIQFGQGLAIGDVNGDGRIDLVEGAQGVDEGGGFVTFGHGSFCPGAPTGPVRCRAMARNAPPTTFEAGAPGPASLAVGDVTGDGYDDVVQGVPFTSFSTGGTAPAGEVRVWRGTPRGPSRRPIVITQNTGGVPGSNQSGDRFGAAVAVGRLDGDRYADIVVGTPGEDRGAGRVTIIRGARSGHARTGNVGLERGGSGLPGRRRQADQVGFALSLLDVNGDRRMDLAIGAPGAFTRSQASLIVARAARVRHIRRAFSTRRMQTLRFRTVGVPPMTEITGTLGSVLGRGGAS